VRKLILVGAGPGDPELISLKGMKALQSADVVLYDALVHKDLLNHTRNADIIYVGKRGGEHAASQDEINKLIVEHALKNKIVVRLKGGDPFIFGRGQEEIEYAAQHGIETEVIPGISSATGIPALHNIPLTRRGSNESVWITTGTTSACKLSEDIEIAAKSSATVVVLMGMSQLHQIVSVFKKFRGDRLPVAIIQNGSLQHEKSIAGTVSTIEKQVEEARVKSPAIIILGEVAALLGNRTPDKKDIRQ
jgi:uroporphyrin-III C-methyltransferase